MDKLQKLEETRKELSEKRKQLTSYNKIWKTFKYLYHKQTWYMELIYLSGVGIANASQYENVLGPEYKTFVDSQPSLKGLTPQKVGLAVSEQIAVLSRDIKDLQFLVKDLLMDLWEEEKPLKVIAKAYGATENATYVAINRCPRFQQGHRRRDHKE